MWTVLLVVACLVHCLPKIDLHEIVGHCQKLALWVYAQQSTYMLWMFNCIQWK